MMDRFEKHAEYIMRRGDKILAEKEKKNKAIRRISFSFAGVFAAIIVGFFAWKSTPPEINSPSDSIIIESDTATTSTYIDTTSPQTTTRNTSSSNNTSKIETSHKVTTTGNAITSTVAAETSTVAATKNDPSNTSHKQATEPVASQTQT
jgi:hypothetical protein